MLHFQHEQADATIRATEVKAKLDRYLWDKLWRHNFDAAKKFLVGYSPDKDQDIRSRFIGSEQYRALDYKLRLSALDVNTWKVPDRQPLYFGNMGSETGEKEEKCFVEARSGVIGSIVSMHDELLTILRQHITAFFQVENFGTRQSKGFGSFHVASLDGNQLDLPRLPFHSFTIDKPELPTLWENIDLFYRTLRSGINLKGAGRSDRLYFKALIYHFAQTKGEEWDKRQIKKDLFFDPNDRGKQVPLKGEPRLYRDMLGLSSEQSWYSYKASVSKSAKNGQIDRFKSPITFKPYRKGSGWIVYIIPGVIPQEMKNASFVIESKGKKTTLVTPEFDLNDYFKFAFSYFNTDNTVEDYVGDHLAPKEVKILENIYQQLSKQVKS